MEQLFYVILVESDDFLKYKLLHILLRWVTEMLSSMVQGLRSPVNSKLLEKSVCKDYNNVCGLA